MGIHRETVILVSKSRSRDILLKGLGLGEIWEGLGLGKIFDGLGLVSGLKSRLHL